MHKGNPLFSLQLQMAILGLAQVRRRTAGACKLQGLVASYAVWLSLPWDLATGWK